MRCSHGRWCSPDGPTRFSKGSPWQRGGKLTGLDAGPRDGAALEAGTLAIVSQFLELLVVLVGESLAMRLGW